MKFWIDKEHDESHPEVQVISLGAVAEDGREFYAISTDFEPANAKPFVQDQVVPQLESPESGIWMPPRTIASAFWAFVGDEPAEFWSLIATCDWYVVTRLLFGGIVRLPSNWLFECWDLHQ